MIYYCCFIFYVLCSTYSTVVALTTVESSGQIFSVIIQTCLAYQRVSLSVYRNNRVWKDYYHWNIATESESDVYSSSKRL